MAANPLTLVQPEGADRPRLLTAAKFLSEFKPIESIIDGLPAGRGALVSITGATGSGKTTLMALLEVSLVTGRQFAGKDVTRGSVLVLAGENPDDYAMHLKATLQDLGIGPKDLSSLPDNRHLIVVPGTFNVLNEVDFIDKIASLQCPDLVAVVVDTSAAFFMGNEENGNVDMRRHASALRELTTLPGNPTVFVLCHPVKNATKDNLLPRGGGAFIAEVDANLTLHKDDAGIVTLHWLGKIRGGNFDPIKFELHSVELADVRDCRDKPIHSVVARHVPDERAEQIQAKELDDEDQMLLALHRKPGASIRDLAMSCGWVSATMKPLATRVDRRLKILMGQGLAEQDRKGKWKLTTRGTKEAESLR